MRLTLRTLLAYLDDLLDPQDAEELGKRIEESTFASGLVHRIRSCTRRLRLGAPPLEGRGLGGDPNTVSEYLDNALPQDRVPDFEKNCLESEVHLAEVAACHQILTLVLGEPCEDLPDLRSRVYGLKYGRGDSRTPVESDADDASSAGDPSNDEGARSAVDHDGTASDSTGADCDQKDDGVAKDANGRDLMTPASRRSLEVPEYLRDAEPRRGRFPLVGILGLAMLVGAVALFVWRPWQTGQPTVADGDPGTAMPLTSPMDPDSATTDSTGNSGLSAGQATPESASKDAAAGPDSRVVASPPVDDPGVPGQPGGSRPAVVAESDPASDAKAPDPAGDAKAPDPASDAKTPGELVPAASQVQQPPNAGERQVDAGTPKVGLDPPPGKMAPLDNAAIGRPPADRPPVVANKGSPLILPGEPVGPPPATDPRRPLFPQPGASGRAGEAGDAGSGDLPAASGDRGSLVKVGLHTESQLLLRYDDGAGDWMLVPPNGSIFAGDRLQVLPASRPHMVLSPGVQATIAGDTSLELQRAESPGGVELVIHRGRTLLLPVAEAGFQLGLSLAGRHGKLTYSGANAAVALEVMRFLPPGSDPETDPAWMISQLFVTNGKAVWQELKDGSPTSSVTLTTGQVLVLIADQPGRVEGFDEPPSWVDAQKWLSPIDRETSLAMGPLVDVERPVGLSFLELTRHRKPDIRALASRGLASLGQYDALVGQIRDENQKAYWDASFDALRAGVARGPVAGKAIREAWERLDPELAPSLYRLTWGYSPPQLERGSAEELVGLLEHPRMEMRVLAFQNLKRITGGATLTFRPEEKVENERSKVKRWRQRLAEGGVRYSAAPEPLPRRPAIAVPMSPDAVRPAREF